MHGDIVLHDWIPYSLYQSISVWSHTLAHTLYLFCTSLLTALPEGEAPFQYYSIATPNGQKPAILLEELGIEYDAHKVKINGEQFTSGFVDICPNSKIPAAVDKDGPGGKPVRLFESGT
jgi:hypothetical protein